MKEGIDDIVDERKDNPSESSDKICGLNLLLLGIPTSIKSGVVTATKNLSNAFSQRGANVRIINHWWNNYSYTENGRVIEVKQSPYSVLGPDLKQIAVKWSLEDAIKALQKDEGFIPDICHSHTHTFYEDSAVQSLLGRMPIVHTLHALIPYLRMNREDKTKLLAGDVTREEIEEIKKNNYHGRERGQEGMISVADNVIAISEVHKQAFDMLYPEHSQKCFFVPNGTDFGAFDENTICPERIRNCRERYLVKGEKALLYIGRIEEKKGARHLSEGFNMVAERYRGTKLLVVGQDDISRLLNYGLSDAHRGNVHCVPWITDRKELGIHYIIADAVVQPVFSPNLYSLVALEAMMMRCPVISCPGELTIGDTNTPENILRSVEIVFNPNFDRERHTAAVRDKVMRNYSLEALYDNHLRVYKSVLE